MAVLLGVVDEAKAVVAGHPAQRVPPLSVRAVARAITRRPNELPGTADACVR